MTEPPAKDTDKARSRRGSAHCGLAPQAGSPPGSSGWGCRGSGRCRRCPGRVQALIRSVVQGPVSAQVQPALPLASGQVGGYVQQPERGSFRAPHAVHRPTVARWRKQASRFAAGGDDLGPGHVDRPMGGTATCSARGALACLMSFSTCTLQGPGIQPDGLPAGCWRRSAGSGGRVNVGGVRRS